MKVAKFVLPCLFVLAGNASVARADFGNLGLAYLFGYGGFGPQVRSFTPAPPYFALHPPVYYGQRYTRPYGASPFAAWPQLQSSPYYAPSPHVSRAPACLNPYVTGAASHGTAPASVRGGIVSSRPIEPLVIDNPYYKPQVQYTSQSSVE